MLAPAEASRSWRRLDSALSITIVRLNCSMSRFVATSTTCGSGAHRVVVDAALEVDDDDRQVVGVVVEAQRHEQRLQELGLARPGRAADQAVRAVADEVDDHRQRPTPCRPTTVVCGDIDAQRSHELPGDGGPGEPVEQVDEVAPMPPRPLASSWRIGRSGGQPAAARSAADRADLGDDDALGARMVAALEDGLSAASVTVSVAPTPSGARRRSMVMPTTPARTVGGAGR